MTSKLHLETALLPEGWRDDVVVSIENGRIAAVGEPKRGEAVERVSGIALPGLANLHSHAFQRAMAGLTERRSTSADSFWTWRETMYRFVERLGPDEAEAIASLAYMEMLEAGFTAVAEFHYLHHQPDGRPYDDPREMSERIVSAACETGIGLTLLPVLYRQGGFGKPPGEAQRRFVCDRDAYALLMETKVPVGRIGIAPHSLRAVSLDDLKWAAASWRDVPAHIHVAEQTKEVDDCRAAHGQRPVELLLDTVEVGPRWCLVHATHTGVGEFRPLAASGATVGLCPVTEANLGDGMFGLQRLLAEGGGFGVGSDSNVRISAADELRTLEYGHRLTFQSRNIFADAERSTGRLLFEAASAGAARAVGLPMGAIAAGNRADFAVLDRAHPTLALAKGDAAIDAWLFAADNGAVKTVYAAGKALVQNGRHIAREAIVARYAKAMAALG